METKIPFNLWSRDKLRNGIKTVTSRTTKYGDVDDTFKAVGKNYRITAVMKLPLRTIADEYYFEEGCSSPDDFKKIWCEIHPISRWIPNKEVYLHFFEEVKPDG